MSALIESKKNRREEEDNGAGNNERRSRRLPVSDIISLAKCKANHVSDITVEQIQRMLGSIKRYIESFEVQEIYLEGYE